MDRVPTYGHRHTIGINRRELIQAGYCGLLGLGLPAAMSRAARAAAPAPRQGKAKAMILVFLTGGPSHLDTFDLKPDAPAEVRGDFKPIETSVPGIRICEHLPELAKRMDRLAVVRSMTHRNAGHLPATHWVLTGYPIPGIPEDSGADKVRSRTDWPSYSSALDYFHPRADGIPNGVNLPTYLQEPPLLWPGQYAGCLGALHDPWQITDDPNKAGFKVTGLSLPPGFGIERMENRRALLQQMNARQDGLSVLAEAHTLSEQQRLAFTMLTSGGFRSAFELDREPTAVRDRYGRHMYGQSLLLARRLVEAGVPIVQANMGIVQTWDTHGENWKRLKESLLPPLDRGVSALMDDLRERGLADETLVIVTGEFGRSPKIGNLPGSPSAGRDHWPDAFSTVFSGAGIRGGQVIGSSDATGAQVASQPYTPNDLGATVYHLLGIDPASEFVDREGRPVRLNRGQVIEPLFTGRG